MIEHDAQPAESSPAPVAAPSLASLSNEDRAAWRKTGSLPDAAAASSAATPVQQDSSTEERAAPASEPGLSGKPAKKNAESRIQELLADRHARDTRIAELEQRLASPPPQRTDAPAASSPAPVDADFPEYDAWTEQAGNESKTYTQYQVALTRHVYAQEQQAIRQQEDAKASERAQADRVQKYRESAETFVADHADYWTVVNPITQTDLPTKGMKDAFEDAIEQSPNAPALLYHLGTHLDVFNRLIGLPERLAIYELGKLERTLSGPASPVIKTLSTAPPPAPTLGSKPATPVDDVEGAVKRRDFATYKLAMNRRSVGAR